MLAVKTVDDKERLQRQTAATGKRTDGRHCLWHSSNNVKFHSLVGKRSRMDSQQRYDIAIIGGGPGGLAAARAAARQGAKCVLLERLYGPGLLGHPCGGVITPVPGPVSARETEQGLFFPEVDLTVPFSMILGRSGRQRYMSPAGHTIAFDTDRPGFPVAFIDKSALLCQLADQAAAAGAALRYGQAATGLVEEDGRVVGVRTEREVIQAQVVLAAEGATRTFTQAAGLYASDPPPYGYVFVVSQELESPRAGAADVGQIGTVGQRYGAPPHMYATTIVPAPGRASIHLNFFSDSPRVHLDTSFWEQLEKYKRDDPRVHDLLAGSREVSRSGCRMVLRQVPPTAVRDGFAGVGDSVGPGRKVSIMPAIFLGQEAGRIAAEAVQAGDTSAHALAAYDELLHAPFLRRKERESKMMSGLSALPDPEIDRVCQTLSRLNLTPMFQGKRSSLVRELLHWLVTSLPLIVRDWKLIREIF